MWADLERRQLRATFIRAADQLARWHLGAGRFRDAIALAKRVRDADQDAESGWRLLLESLLAARDSLHAAIEADALERLLAADDREPEPATRAFLRFARQTPVLGATANASDAPPGLAPETVGREREFAAVLAAWEDVRAGRAHRFLVTSAAGFGKSRLLADVASRIRAGRGRAVLVRASQGDRSIPYSFVSEIAAALATLKGARAIAPQSAATLVALNPTLSSHYSVGPDSSQGDEAARHRTLALTELIGCVAAETPLALLLDDIHWADDESRRAIRGALERIDAARVLVFAATRPGFESGAYVPRHEALALAPLTNAEIGDLLSRLGALPASAWADTLAPRLHAATDGSPLLVIETLHLLLERGVLALGEAGWTSVDAAALNETLAAGSAIVRRLEQLGRGEQWLLLLLATSGAPMDEPSLAKPSSANSADVRASLSQLELRGFVIDGDGMWRVAHDEIADQMIAFAKPDAVRAAHLAAGRAAADVEPVTLNHLTRAVRHFAKAGDEEAQRRTFRRALSVSRLSGLRKSPDDLARSLLAPDATTEQVARLAGAAPPFDRPGVRRAAFAGAAVLLLSAGLLLGRTLLADRVVPAEAELLVMLEDSAHMRRVVALPVSEAMLSRTEIIDLADPSLRELRGLGDLFSAAEIAAAVTPGRYLFTRTYQETPTDSGGIDIALREPGGIDTRLTNSPRDDGGARFFPQERFAAISSARFDANDHRMQLVIVDLRTAAARRLTRSDGNDRDPVPSPDGTRVAFVRSFADGRPNELCWISFDGLSRRCRTAGNIVVEGLLGWTSPDEVVAITDSAGNLLATRTPIDGGPSSTILRVNSSVTASRDARFIAQHVSAMSYRVAYLGTNQRWVTLRVPHGARVTRMLWRPLADSRFVDHVSIVVPAGGIARGLPYLLQARVTDSAGQEMTPGVMRWSSLDPSVASVDSTGLLLGLRDGTVRVVASAGGWRADTATMVVRAPRFELLLTEDWSSWPPPQFRLFGSPLPRRVRSGGGDFAFHNNGDNSFPSGGYSRTSWPAQGGLGIEFPLHLHFTQLKWQTINVQLTADLADSVLMAWDHETGAINGGGRWANHATCGLAIPANEGVLHRHRTALTNDVGGMIVTEDSTIGADRWMQVRLQIFPDGRCGVALDGRARSRLPVPLALDRPFRVIVQGMSVGTEVLVGPMTIWSGVKQGVEWSVLDRRK